MIVNVDRAWGIGRDGGLLFHIPQDMRFFREKTTGGAVIMGRCTQESLPGGRPLRDRLNIVLSRRADYEPGDGFTVCTEIAQAVDACAHVAAENVYVIGGAEVYEQMRSACDTAYVTMVDAEGGADRAIRSLDTDPEWELAEILSQGESDGLAYEIRRYVRRTPPASTDKQQ